MPKKKPIVVRDDPVLPTFQCPFCGTPILMWEKQPTETEWFALCRECSAGAIICAPISEDTRLYLR